MCHDSTFVAYWWYGYVRQKSLSMAVGSMLLVYTFVYDLTIGPMCYCIVGEMPSSKLRAKTVMLARNLYNIAGIIVAIVTPYMLNPTQWNWKAKSAFLWAGFAILSAIWVYFELPETKGRTFAELIRCLKIKFQQENSNTLLQPL